MQQPHFAVAPRRNVDPLHWILLPGSAQAWGDIILSLIIFGIYGSILFGIVPSDPKISWEARDHAPPTPTSTPFDPLP